MHVLLAMKFFFNCCSYLLILISGNNVFSQSVTRHDYSADVALFANQLASGHPYLYKLIPEDTFDVLIKGLKNKAHSISSEELAVELFRINACIADEHTRVEPIDSLLFPFRFELFDEGMAVIITDSLHQEHLFYRVLAIDGHAIAEVLHALSGILKKDNISFQKFWIAYYLNRPAMLYGLAMLEQRDRAIFTFLTPSGDTVSTTIQAVPAAVVRLNYYRNLPMGMQFAVEGRHYDYKYDDTTGLLFFEYARCSEEEELHFREFNKQLFDIVKAKHPSKLIVDLRFNGGGSSSVLNPFLKSIKSSYLNAPGKLYVLTGRKTFSSALMNAIELVRSTDAITIGEATGANINHYGEVKSFVLPDSKIIVYYSTKYWENWPGHDGPLVPDVSLEHRYSNFIEGRDEALEYILHH